MDNTPEGRDRTSDRSISLLAANLIAVVFALPLFGIMIPLYGRIWGPQAINIETSFDLIRVFLMLFIFFAGIFAHEFLHGISWQIFGGMPHGAIEYGVMWKLLTPYAHVKEPIDVWAYRLGGLMPGLVLGMLPLLGGLVLGVGWLFSFGLLFTWAAAGDFTVLWLLRDVKPGTLVKDHPSRAGCMLFEGEC